MNSGNNALFETLSPDQVEELEKLSGCNYSPEDIAMYLDVDLDQFLQEWGDEKSKISYHYKRGKLKIQAQADMSISEAASQGNITAYQQYHKSLYFRKLEDFKLKQQLDAEIKDIDNLQRFMARGDIGEMTDAMQAHYEILDFVRRLNAKYKSKNFIVNALLKSFPEFVKGRRKAVELYADAINFFYADNEISQQAWCNYYADRYDDAAALCLEMNDMDNHQKYLDKAAKLRGCFEPLQQKIPEEMYRKQFVIYSFDTKLFNLKREDRKKVKEWINKLPDLREEDRLQLHRDNLSEDVEFELISEPDEDQT